MGKRGPKPTPTSLKLVRGTARGKDKRRNEPKPPCTGVPRCPKDFPPEAKSVFKRLAPILTAIGLLTSADVESFQFLCLHAGLARRAALEMFKAGLTDEDEHHVARKSPLNQLLKEHSEAYRKYAARFGLSPADRAEIDLPEVYRNRRDRLLGQDNPLSKYIDHNRWEGFK